VQVVEQLISPGNILQQPKWSAGLSSDRLGPPAWQASHLQAGNVTVSSSGVSTAIQHADEPAGAVLSVLSCIWMQTAFSAGLCSAQQHIQAQRVAAHVDRQTMWSVQCSGVAEDSTTCWSSS